MPRYYVGLKIINSFYVEADSEFEAEEKVQNLDTLDLLDDADYEITYVDEEKTNA